MTHPTGNLSDEQYANGLRIADEATLKGIYSEFRRPIVRAITQLGGSEATGRFFFQTALIEAARSLQTENWPQETPFYFQLKTYALAHYADWLSEREQPAPEIVPDPDMAGAQLSTPDPATLRETRHKISAWKKSEQTGGELHALWQKLQTIERNGSETGMSDRKSHFARNLAIAIALLVTAILVYMYFNRSKTPAEVYDDNFTPPESLMADLALRYGPELGNDSVTARPNACEKYLREADEYYKTKDYDAATETLYQILDESLHVCESDALFYIGVIALAQEEPGLALECFSKIEDLEHFGEDVYWYQALAMVKLAESNPLLHDKAVRAVDRARSNARDSLRRAQAERILKNLGE